MAYYPLEPKFQIGRIFCTPGVIALGIDPTPYIWRHHCGEWKTEDAQANRDALMSDEPLLSQFEVTDDRGKVHNLVIMTEDDRSITLLMLDWENLENIGIE